MSGPATPKPVKIAFAPPPEDPRDFARRLRVMAAVTTPGVRIRADIEPETARRMAAMVEMAAAMNDRLAAGDLMTLPEVEARIDRAARQSGAFFAADVRAQLRRAAWLPGVYVAAALCFGFAVGIVGGAPW